MAMVRQLTEGEIINSSTPEDDSQSEHLENFNGSRPASRSSSGSKRSSPAVMPALQYSMDDLMKYSSLPLSQERPSCLDPAYNNSSGKWDPERWFMNHRNDRPMALEESRSKRERQEDVLSGKRKSSDPKERIKDEKDDIVLSPQRRSFGTGCHVIPQSSLARRPGSPTDGRDSENFRDSSRRIGSGRIMRDQRDWERDREYGYGNNRSERRDRFDQDDNDKDLRRYPNRYNRNDRRSRSGHNRIDEVEPEWFSSGPTSQSETIELVGFDDPRNDNESRKPNKKGKRKQNSRRSSLKSDEGDKQEIMVSLEVENSKTEEDLKKPIEEICEEKPSEETKDDKPIAGGFEVDALFNMDWMPSNDEGTEIGCSRFSQWFRRDSPVNDLVESRNHSRRSSLQEELIANVINSVVEPSLSIPSPTDNSSDNFFTPISPAQSHTSSYIMPPSNTNKDVMDMFQSVSNDTKHSLGHMKDSGKTVQELEADLKKLVLGDQKQEEKSAFDKLLQHMSDSRNSPATSLSIGPLDKSKAVQEQDLLQDMMRTNQSSSNVSPVQQVFHMFEEKQPMFKLPTGMSSQFSQQSRESQNELFAQLLQQKQHEQQMQHIHQQQQQMQMQNQMQQQQQQPQGLTVDMLAKLLGTSQPSASPSPALQSATNMSRSDTQVLNSAVMQYQRQRELLTSILKQQQQQHHQQQHQQQQQQQHNLHNLSQSNVLQPPMQQPRRCPSSKDIPIQQTLALPTLGISPRQSPLPSDTIGSAIPSQGRIPSPLVFGQQPPALSHAPAPIHPAALAQAMVQNAAASSNTLQVQNPVVLQRVPSPQELAVHTQSILQNALIKRKLEEQKENFRKRQEAQRAISPVPTTKNGMTPSPLKGMSPTIAFTPTSVIRKIQSEKVEHKEQKNTPNGSDPKVSDPSQMFQKTNAVNMLNAGLPTSFDSSMNTMNNSHLPASYTNANLSQAPRAVHGQARSILGGMNSVGPIVIPNQGRPIVKVGMTTQPINSNADLSRQGMVPNKNPVTHKSFLQNNNQSHNMHQDIDSNFEAINKYSWHQQLARQQNTSAMPQIQMAATYAALNQRPPPLNPHHSGLLRPVNMASNASVPASAMNFPVLRNTVQNPIRAQTTNPLNQLNQLGQLAALQFPRGSIDNRQFQALAQSQRLHPAIQQMLMNSQNQVTAAQAQVIAGFPGNRDSKHQHLMPGQASTNRSSPVNLAKWFGNDVLKQKMPDMPPVSHQKALLVEEVERQQKSTVVHN